MRILITNDDGINAEGLKILVDWAKTIGEVTVFAPKVEQSGKSHSIEIHKAYELKKVDIFEGVEAYSVDSTPADCVRIAVIAMKGEYDLVISGINRGFNLGGDIRYSGTLGACFEASKLGIKAMGVSTCYEHFNSARANIDRAFEYIRQYNLFDYTPILNVNIPDNAGDILITEEGPAIYGDAFDRSVEDMVLPVLEFYYDGTKNLALDTDATMNGYITITPLTPAVTNYVALEKIRKIVK